MDLHPDCENEKDQRSDVVWEACVLCKVVEQAAKKYAQAWALVRYFIMSPVMVSTPSAPGPASELLRFRRQSFATSLVDKL